MHTNVYGFPGEKDKRRYQRRRVVFSGDSCILYWWVDRISAGYFWKHVRLVSPSLEKEWHALIKKYAALRPDRVPFGQDGGARREMTAS